MWRNNHRTLTSKTWLPRERESYIEHTLSRSRTMSSWDRVSTLPRTSPLMWCFSSMRSASHAYTMPLTPAEKRVLDSGYHFKQFCDVGVWQLFIKRSVESS